MSPKRVEIIALTGLACLGRESAGAAEDAYRDVQDHAMKAWLTGTVPTAVEEEATDDEGFNAADLTLFDRPIT